MGFDFWQIVILAAVQGVTEFLPISSSGHLVVTATILSSGQVQQLDFADVSIVLHLGTLGSILIFYFQEIRQLFIQERRTIPLLVVATIPTGIIGVPLLVFAADWLNNPSLAGALLVVTGMLLLRTARIPTGIRSFHDLSYVQAGLIGVAQAFATLPGLSRSGMTICTGLAVGLRPRDAATFSFLMAIPAIFGAGLWEVAKLLPGLLSGEITLQTGEISGTPLFTLASGAFIAFAVGYVSLRWLIAWLECGRLRPFAWWCILGGALIVVWQWSLH